MPAEETETELQPQVDTARKQELINELFWLHQSLLESGRPFEAGAVDRLRIDYIYALDVDRAYQLVTVALRKIKQAMALCGIDCDTGLREVMQRNGYSSLSQLQPQVAKVVKFPVMPVPIASFVKSAREKDPWD